MPPPRIERTSRLQARLPDSHERVKRHDAIAKLGVEVYVQPCTQAQWH